MGSVLIFLFVLVCIMLLAIILLQSGKGGGMGSAISGQSMNEAFGGGETDKLLVKLTSFLAFAFMVIAVSIGKYTKSDGIDIKKFSDDKQEVQQEADGTDTTKIN